MDVFPHALSCSLFNLELFPNPLLCRHYNFPLLYLHSPGESQDPVASSD